MIRAFSLLVALTTISLHAHSINIFAEYEGDVLKGKAYSGGRGIANATVAFRDVNGTQLGTAKTDSAGTFEFRPATPASIDCQLLLEDGHGCRYRVDIVPEPGTAPHSPATQDLSSEGAHNDLADLKNQIHNMELMLHEQAHRAGLRDIIGGIGYILGLAGVVALIKTKKATS